MSELERQYRKAVSWFPRAWRRENEDALIGLLLDQADGQGRVRVSAADRRNLAWNGLRQRVAATPIVLIGAVFVLVAVLALVAFSSGAYPFGNANDADLCRVTQPLPRVGGPYDAPDSRASVERTWFPLGVACTLDSQHDTVGAQITHHQSWAATWAWLLATGLTVLTFLWLLLAARTTRRGRRRQAV